MKEDENTPEQLELFNAQPYAEEAWKQQEASQRRSTPFELKVSQKTQREVVGTADFQQSRETATPKKKRVPLMLGLLLFAIAAIAGTGIFHSYYVYQGYQQGSCTIQSGTVLTGSTKNVPYYTPNFAYIVLPKAGGHVLSSGYGAPTSTHFSTADEAQQVVDHYTVGFTYPCWYDTADPAHAALVFQGYPLNQAIGTYIGITPILFVMLILFFMPFYRWVYQPLRMRSKRVHTQGQVTEQGVQNAHSAQSALGCSFAFGVGLCLFLLAVILSLVVLLWFL